MARIQRTADNLFEMPKGAFIVNQRYVYVNTGNKYISGSERKTGGKKGYTGHDCACIGVLQDPADRFSRMFYANAKYRNINSIDELPEPPAIADSVSVGLQTIIRKIADEYRLTALLTDVFGTVDAALVLDLASYMISKESAVMQHFPAWARDHGFFSESIRSDSYLGAFLRKNLTPSKIKAFRKAWLKENIGSGYIYLCYDSTNVNCQATGVFVVQRGHAKDDPTLDQVNTDYVIRQDDGLPLTYLHSPGSVTDIVQAQEMIRFIDETVKLTGIDVTLCLICDRGYISAKNLKLMDNASISYLLMLRSDLLIFKELAEQSIDHIRTYKNLLQMPDDEERYGCTIPCQLYADGPICYAHVYWSANYFSGKRKAALNAIDRERSALETFIKDNQSKSFEEKELKGKFSPYFTLKLEPGEPIIVTQKKRGRGTGTKNVPKPTVHITGYEDNANLIDREILKAGIIIMVSKDAMTAQEAEERYHKRDCVEKAFEALKSHMGMDKIGVTTEEAIHGKGLVWFVASILHSLLFNQTSELRTTDRKNFTTEAMVDQLEAIKADKDMSKGTYTRRYKLTRKQSAILSCFGLTESAVDEQIQTIST